MNILNYFKSKYIFLLFLILGLISIGFFMTDETEDVPSITTKSVQENNIIKNGQETVEIKDMSDGEESEIENLKITVFEPQKSIYTVLERVSENGSDVFRRINKSYYKIYAKIFNPDWNEKVVLSSIKLVDNLDNEYLPTKSPDYFAKLKEFGKDTNVYPRMTKEGYLIFLDVNEKAKKLELIFEIGSEKEVFKFSV